MENDFEGKKYSILIIEDQNYHQILSQSLNNQRFKVKFSTSSFFGSELLKDQKFDAILYDYNLIPENEKKDLKYLHEIRKKDNSYSLILMSVSTIQTIAIEVIEQYSDKLILQFIPYSQLGSYLIHKIENRDYQPSQVKDTPAITNIEDINPFKNFLILKNSIPIFVTGEWHKEADSTIINSTDVNSQQILMGGILNAIQRLSEFLFGHVVSELSLRHSKIIFKKVENYICGVKISNNEFELISIDKDNLNFICDVLESIAKYLIKVSKNNELLKLNNDIEIFIKNRLNDEFHKFKSKKKKKSFFEKIKRKKLS